MPLWGRRAVAALVLLAAVLVVSAVVSDVVLYHRGAQLERDIAAEHVTDLNDLWNKWTELSQGNSSSWVLDGPRKAVKQRLVAAADRVIDSYRNADTVSENSWKGAQVELAHALSLDPDETVRGKLRLTEGHLARITGNRERGAAGIGGFDPGGGEVYGSGPPDAEIARPGVGSGAGLRVRAERHRQGGPGASGG